MKSKSVLLAILCMEATLLAGCNRMDTSMIGDTEAPVWERGDVIERTGDQATVYLDSWWYACSTSPANREAWNGESWEKLEAPPALGRRVQLDGVLQPVVMCCLPSCIRAEQQRIDLQRYTLRGKRLPEGFSDSVWVYDSEPLRGRLRATFEVFADSACTIPRKVDVTLDL